VSSGLAPLLARGRSFWERHFVEPDRPAVAIEVRAGSVGVVRLVTAGGVVALGAAALVELPPGTLALSMTEPNLKDEGAFGRTLRSALERAGVPSGARVALVVPDPVARVALVPTAEVTAKRRDQAEELVRFKIRKSIPFDVRDARIAYLAGGGESTLVAAIYRPVLDGYEAACRAQDLTPGIVELTGPGLLTAAFGALPPADRLLVNWDEGYLTLMLARGAWPLLVRTITGPPASSPADVAREVANTVLYYRDRLGGTALAATVLRSAWLPPAEAVALLAGPLGAPPSILDGLSGLRGGEGAGSGGAAQALAGAVCCARGTLA
jgi:type IV pilus assembly protein PilM